MDLSRKIILTLTAIVSATLMSCGTEEPDEPATSPTTSHHTSSTTGSTEVKPIINNVSSTSTTTEFAVTFKVKSVDYPSVSLKYSAESSKTSSPSLNKTSTPTIYNVVSQHSGGYSWYYYRARHTGFRGGAYIYYQVTASNSKGSDKSSVGYVIIKR